MKHQSKKNQNITESLLQPQRQTRQHIILNEWRLKRSQLLFEKMWVFSLHLKMMRDSVVPVFKDLCEGSFWQRDQMKSFYSTGTRCGLEKGECLSVVTFIGCKIKESGPEKHWSKCSSESAVLMKLLLCCVTLASQPTGLHCGVILQNNWLHAFLINVSFNRVVDNRLIVGTLVRTTWTMDIDNH